MRLSRKAFEAVASRLDRRAACDLYHSALVARRGDDDVVVEQAPDPGGDGAEQGVVAWAPSARAPPAGCGCLAPRCAAGPAARSPISPKRLRAAPPDRGPGRARRLRELVTTVPTPVWGWDELETGEMWNSTSTISWLLTSSGPPARTIAPPRGGRAPGWHAGVIVAERHAVRSN